MDQSESRIVASKLLMQSLRPHGEILEFDGATLDIRDNPSHPLPTTSINLKAPTNFFRKNREKILAMSSSTSSQGALAQRPTRLRRSNVNKTETRVNPTTTLSCAKQDTGTSVETPKGKLGKMLPPPLTPNQALIRRLFDKINRTYKASMRESLKQVWKDNQESLNCFVKKHHRMQSAMATSSILLSHAIVQTSDIVDATLKSDSNKSTTTEKIKVIVSTEKSNESSSKFSGRVVQTIPVTTIGHVTQIPPVLDWTAIPHNLHEDDGKFLTNIPFLGDEFIDKDAKFIDEMVTLYEGKVHEAKDSSSYRKMDDEVLCALVQAMMKIEAEEGPDVFKEGPAEKAVMIATDESPNLDAPMEVDNVNKEEIEDSKKISFSDAAAKILQPDATCCTTEPVQNNAPNEIYDGQSTDAANISATEKGKEKRIDEVMEVELKESQPEKRKCSGASASSSDELDATLFNDTKVSEHMTKPSDQIFSLLSSTFKGLGMPNEIRERYLNAVKFRSTPILPILSNGMEQHTPQSYSIPNIEGPFAKYLPKEATMHAYHVLFCRRCFTYDCKRHTGDDQVDVKYYKNRQIPLLSTSPASSLSSVGAFNFLCKNPDCWQMNDVATRSPESILLEWSPSDRSLFSCLIESFPTHYCFIAYMMRNKSCAQVKEYADLENVPKMEVCHGSRSSRTKAKHRKQRLGFNKKTSSHSHSKRNFTRRWINNVKKTEKSREEGGIKSPGVKLPPRYMPCLHDKGVECDSTCSCRINKTSCEKFCTCALTCPYRFPGCKCLSTCDSKRCICFAAARECDPDLCVGCGAHEHSLEKISCHNVNIQRKLHKHLLMGRSDISGWGIYIKNDAQKGEFIAEYRGELISHDESERRGCVYDKIQHTFLFELNDHFVVDATRKGNKARFVNSSKNPNCEVKRMFVNGDHRIGIYAKRFIEAGEELFYDYEDVLEKQQKASEGAHRNYRD